MHLAGEQQRIERRAEVVDHHVVQDARRAGLRIDLDLGEMGAVGIGRLLRREGVLGRKRAAARRRTAGELGERDHAIGAGHAHRAVGDLEIARRRFERIGGNAP